MIFSKNIVRLFFLISFRLLEAREYTLVFLYALIELCKQAEIGCRVFFCKYMMGIRKFLTGYETLVYSDDESNELVKTI